MAISGISSSIVKALAVASVVVLPSCILSPEWTVAGSWSSRSGKFATWVLELEQSGTAITGTACYSDGTPIYSHVPVNGEFPHLTALATPEHFGSPWITDGVRLEAEAVSRDAIGASLIYAGGHRTALGFKRDDTARCD